jgi:hypothetical protein
MRGERQLLRLGEYLVARACQRLPRDTREERCREWAAELPAILHDPQVRFAPWRAVRMLGYAADTLRGAAKTPGRTPGPIARPGPVVALPFLVIGLVGLAAGIRAIVQEPGGGQNYLQLTWSLLFAACFLSRLVHAPARMTTLLVFGSGLALEVLNVWQVAQAPGEWVNCVWAVLLGLVLLAPPLVALRARRSPMLREAWARAATESVEIACAGGCGPPGRQAIAYVRGRYASHVIGTPWQRRFVTRFR